VKEALSKANIKFRLYSDHFKKGEDDELILQLCGRHGWAMLTCDRKNRYRELERRTIIRSRVRQFVFSGNLGGEQLARLLVSNYSEMRRFAREHERPFIAVVTKAGNVYLRMDSKGNVSRG
jgi:hypothetical protein